MLTNCLSTNWMSTKYLSTNCLLAKYLSTNCLLAKFLLTNCLYTKFLLAKMTNCLLAKCLSTKLFMTKSRRAIISLYNFLFVLEKPTKFVWTITRQNQTYLLFIKAIKGKGLVLQNLSDVIKSRVSVTTYHLLPSRIFEG